MTEKLHEKVSKQLQFYDGFGNLIKFVGLAVLITGIYVNSGLLFKIEV